MTADEIAGIKRLHPQLAPIFQAWLENVEQRRGIEVRVLEGLRTEDRQNELWAIGREFDKEAGVWRRFGKTVTKARGRQTNHFWGVALDVAPKTVLSDPDWDPDHAYWSLMHEEAKRLGLGHPIAWDKPHCEYTEGHSWREWVEKFPDGKLPPDYFEGIAVARVRG